jgi:hypothetical protein
VLFAVLGVIVVSGLVNGLIAVSLGTAFTALALQFMAAMVFFIGAGLLTMRETILLRRPDPGNVLLYGLSAVFPDATQRVGASFLVWIGGLLFITSLLSPVALRERRDGPGGQGKLEYKVVTRGDGKREVEFNARGMKPIDVGVELLSKPEPEAKIKGLRELDFHVDRKDHRRSSILKSLEEFLGNEDPEIRRVAVAAVGHWGTSDTIRVLEKMLDDPDKRVRDEAKHQIDDIKGREKRGET